MWVPPWSRSQGFGMLRRSPADRPMYSQLEDDEILYLGLSFMAAANGGHLPPEYQAAYDRLNSAAPSWLTGAGHNWSGVARGLRSK